MLSSAFAARCAHELPEPEQNAGPELIEYRMTAVGGFTASDEVSRARRELADKLVAAKTDRLP